MNIKIEHHTTENEAQNSVTRCITFTPDCAISSDSRKRRSIFLSLSKKQGFAPLPDSARFRGNDAWPLESFATVHALGPENSVLTKLADNLYFYFLKGSSSSRQGQHHWRPGAWPCRRIKPMSKTFSMTTMLEVFFIGLRPTSGGSMKLFSPPAHAMGRRPWPNHPRFPSSDSPRPPGGVRGRFVEPPFPITNTATTGVCVRPLSMNGRWRKL